MKHPLIYSLILLSPGQGDKGIKGIILASPCPRVPSMSKSVKGTKILQNESAKETYPYWKQGNTERECHRNNRMKRHRAKGFVSPRCQRASKGLTFYRMRVPKSVKRTKILQNESPNETSSYREDKGIRKYKYKEINHNSERKELSYKRIKGIRLSKVSGQRLIKEA